MTTEPDESWPHAVCPLVEFIEPVAAGSAESALRIFEVRVEGHKLCTPIDVQFDITQHPNEPVLAKVQAFVAFRPVLDWDHARSLAPVEPAHPGGPRWIEILYREDLLNEPLTRPLAPGDISGRLTQDGALARIGDNYILVTSESGITVIEDTGTSSDEAALVELTLIPRRVSLAIESVRV